MKKLKTFDRVMAIILLVLLIAFSAGLVLFAWGFLTVFINGSLVAGVQLSNAWRFNINTSATIFSILLTILAAFLVFVAIRILFVRKRNPQQKEMGNMQSGVMLRNGEHGAAYITKDAIQYLVDKQVQAEHSIRDAQSQIDITPEQNVSIKLKVSVMADQNLPEITGKLQESLKEYIQTTTGIAVDAVEVLIAAPPSIKDHQSKKSSSKINFEAATK